MNNIIPKTIRKTKLEFYKGFGLIEALVIGSWVVYYQHYSFKGYQ
ncbi:hypothetical protein [Spiroplasma endosymbiont of Virgichneumon dumeticola]